MSCTPYQIGHPNYNLKLSDYVRLKPDGKNVVQDFRDRFTSDAPTDAQALWKVSDAMSYYQNPDKMIHSANTESSVVMNKAPDYVLTGVIGRESGKNYPAVDRCPSCVSGSNWTGVTYGIDQAYCGRAEFSCPTIGGATPTPIPVRFSNGKFINSYGDDRLDSLRCEYPKNAISNDAQYAKFLDNVQNGNYVNINGDENDFLYNYCLTTSNGIDYPNLKSPYCVDYCARHAEKGDAVDVVCKGNDNLARVSCVGENLVDPKHDTLGTCSKWCGPDSENPLCLAARKEYCQSKLKSYQDIIQQIYKASVGI